MFVISLLCKGGSRTVMGKTLQECRALAKKISSKNNFIGATIPYAVYKTNINGLNIYDVTIPFEIKKGFGPELRLSIEDSE